jgi:hypothetical protein
LFNLTGRVAGLLNHNIMVDPPQFAQDHVFIVIPDSWSFQENPLRGSLSSATPPTTASCQQPVLDPRSKFISPAKRKADRNSNPITRGRSFPSGIELTSPSYTRDTSSLYGIALIRPRSSNN